MSQIGTLISLLTLNSNRHFCPKFIYQNKSLFVPNSSNRNHSSLILQSSSRHVSYSSSTKSSLRPDLPAPEVKLKPWKEAASLIIAAPSEGNDLNSRANFLVMKRSKGSSFAPNTLCFPGGALSPGDSDFKWISLYRDTTGAELSTIDSFLSDSAHHPLLYAKKRQETMETAKDLMNLYREKVPPAVSLRIAAIRETFEETGILICRRNVKEEGSKLVGKEGYFGQGCVSGTYTIKDPDELEHWQREVRKDPAQFVHMCRENYLRPDLNAVVEWSNWLTPNSFGPKRFDTIFYMVVIPHTLPFLVDEFEVATLKWTTAQDLLKGAADGKAKVMPPQIYELTRLKDASVSRIQQLMKMRLQLGIERWCPCYIKASDGLISVLPGDDLYPVDYRITEFEPIRERNETLETIRNTTKRYHRVEFKSEFDFQLVTNISLNHGHIYL